MTVQSFIYNASTGKRSVSGYVPGPNDEELLPAPVPQVVSRFQARAALLDAGILADAELAIAGADVITQLAWSEATEWRRDSPTIATISDSLGLSSSGIDDLFINASKIVA